MLKRQPFGDKRRDVPDRGELVPVEIVSDAAGNGGSQAGVSAKAVAGHPVSRIQPGVDSGECERLGAGPGIGSHDEVAGGPESTDSGHEAWESESGWFDRDAQALVVSLLFHVVLILALAVFPVVVVSTATRLEFTAAAQVEPEDEFTLIEEVAYSDEVSAEVGANSSSDSAQAMSMAPVLSDLSEVPSPSFDLPQPDAQFDLNNQIEQAVGLLRNEVVVKGMTGVAATGTDGAVDRITYEILQSMEERPTLVVWFFDQSGSLHKRRQEIRDRFERIYEELGIIQRTQEEQGRRAADDELLLTSVFAFGERVNLLTETPTADIVEIRAAIDSIDQDNSGIERVFSALYKGVEKYKRYRSSSTGRGPERNVMFIAVTDERGDDMVGLDATIQECRKFAIPVYVIGVPAPFGREFSYVKYVDPDPQYDQTPQWAQVDQGPESIMPERVKLGFREDFFNEPVVDSGFGPYALSRLAYETGGIYFTVHPNRRVGQPVRRGEIEPFASRLEYFFDPEVMVKYRPDYVSQAEYLKRVSASPLRQVLVKAATLPRIETLEKPKLRFLKRDDASLANELTAAQRDAARIEPQLAQLVNLLVTGDEHRDKEASPRWLAGFDLALGTVLLHKVRAETYNAMLAKAKRGMNFSDDKHNTWVLEPSTEISVGSKLEKEGQQGVSLLANVAAQHKGTPWGLLASRELQEPVGWKWVEDFTDLDPPAPNNAANNNNNNTPQPARDEQARMLAKPSPKRPIPKL